MTHEISWIDHIFAPWGGKGSAMAEDIEELAVTVNQWRFRGDIPSRAWTKIIIKAGQRGHILTLNDFAQAKEFPVIVDIAAQHASSSAAA